MVRPRQTQPTPAELEVLKQLWDLGRPASAREMLKRINQGLREPRAYTTVMSLLNVMTEKGHLLRTAQGRAFYYSPLRPREYTLQNLLGETLNRVYDGSASLLVAHLLDQSHPDRQELDQIQELLDAYRKQKTDPSNQEKDGHGCSPPS